LGGVFVHVVLFLSLLKFLGDGFDVIAMIAVRIGVRDRIEAETIPAGQSSFVKDHSYG
jgi:hypothetical protein